METIELHDGRKVTLDYYRVTAAEVFGLQSLTRAEAGAVICKAWGMTAEEFAALPWPEHFKLSKVFYDTVFDPLSDPN